MLLNIEAPANLTPLGEFKSGCNNCRELIAERGESYTRDFYVSKVRNFNSDAPLIRAYWRGYYFVLTKLGYDVPYLWKK
jgi:hypothetical protein